MAKGDGSGWHRESRRHAEAAKKGRPTHARASRARPVKKTPDSWKYTSSREAWNHAVGGEWTAKEFMDYSGKDSIAGAVDAFLDDYHRIPGSNAREMLIKYISRDMGSDKLRAYTREVDGPQDQEWAAIVSDYKDGRNDTLPTEDEVIRYIKAGAFDPDAVVQMYRSDITPDMAGLRTSAGTGGYSGTVGYKISNGDLRVEDLKSR